jgi:hypothetical protein
MSTPANKPDGKSGAPAVWAMSALVVLLLPVAVWRIAGRGVMDVADADAATNRVAVVTALRVEAEKQLTTVGWVDEAKGIARVPISNAMAMVLPELRAKPVKAAGAIPAQGVYGPGVRYPGSFEDPAVAQAAKGPAATAPAATNAPAGGAK